RAKEVVAGEERGIGERAVHVARQQDVVIAHHLRQRDVAAAVDAVPVVATDLRADGRTPHDVRRELDRVVADLEVGGVRQGEGGAAAQPEHGPAPCRARRVGRPGARREGYRYA